MPALRAAEMSMGFGREKMDWPDLRWRHERELHVLEERTRLTAS
jgi:hypothetical protein